MVSIEVEFSALGPEGRITEGVVVGATVVEEKMPESKIT